MFCSLIWLKGLNRCSSLVLPYIVQSAPSLTAVAGVDFLQAPIEMAREPTSRSEMLRRIFSVVRKFLLIFLLLSTWPNCVPWQKGTWAIRFRYELV